MSTSSKLQERRGENHFVRTSKQTFSHEKIADILQGVHGDVRVEGRTEECYLSGWPYCYRLGMAYNNIVLLA